MDQTARSHRISILILLLATAIQAVIPDACNLASFKALTLVGVVLLQQGSPWDDHDPTEEVWGAIPPRSSSSRKLAEYLLGIGFELPRPRPTVPTIGTGVLGSSYHVSPVVRIDDLIESLCRLNC